MKRVLVLDSLLNQTRDRHLSSLIKNQIFNELSTLADRENDEYSLRAYLINHNGKPMQGSEHIFKYQLTAGDRILYTLGKYLPYVRKEDADSIVLIGYSKHDNQGDTAKSFSFFKNRKYTYLSDLIRDLKEVGLGEEGFSDEDLIAVADIITSPDYSRWHTIYVVPDEEYKNLSQDEMEISLVPEQAEILNAFFEAPAPTIVLGGAGTGKTLVAIHVLADFHKSNPKQLAMYFTQSFELREKSKRVFETLTHKDDAVYVEFNDIIEFCIDNLNLSRKDYVDFDRFLAFLHDRKALCGLCEKEKISPVDIWTEIRGTIKGAMSPDWTHHKEYISQEEYGNIEKFVQEKLLTRNSDNKKLFKIADGVSDDQINQKNSKQLHSILKYFSSFDPDKRTLEKEEYFSLPDENATLSKEKRETVWKICEEYEKYLQNNKFFDDNDLVREMFRSKNDYRLPSADLMVVDEIQDYTELQIYLLYRLSSDKAKIAFVGDNHQNVNPTYFSVSRLESLFYKLSGDIQLRTFHLSTNHRCPQDIINRTNALSAVRRRTIAKMSDELEQSETSRKDWLSSVARLRFSEENLKALLEECVKYPGVAILVPDAETKDYAIQCLGEDYYKEQGLRFIFTVPEIKGMEYSYVIAFNLIGKYCQTWNDMLTSEIARKQTKYRYYFNLLYVAMSRTQLHLCFIDKTTSEKLEEVLALDRHDSVNTVELRFSDLIQSDEAWILYAKQLEENGQYEDAIGAYARGKATEKDIIRCRMHIAYKNHEYDTAMKYCILSDSGNEYGERILKELSDGDLKEIGSLYVALCKGSHVTTRSGPSYHIKSISDDPDELSVAKQVFLRHYSHVTVKTIESLKQSTEVRYE